MPVLTHPVETAGPIQTNECENSMEAKWPALKADELEPTQLGPIRGGGMHKHVDDCNGEQKSNKGRSHIGRMAPQYVKALVGSGELTPLNLKANGVEPAAIAKASNDMPARAAVREGSGNPTEATHANGMMSS